MAKIKEIVKSSVKVTVEFSQEEIDILGALVADLADGRVSLHYVNEPSPYDLVIPSEKSKKFLRSIAKALSGVEMSDDYDFFEYWDAVDSEGLIVL